jgi:hypothetical protein
MDNIVNIIDEINNNVEILLSIDTNINSLSNDNDVVLNIGEDLLNSDFYALYQSSKPYEKKIRISSIL